MDSSIGPDIAKLLGNLGVSKEKSVNTASNAEAGAAFKRALGSLQVASKGSDSGKALPATFSKQSSNSQYTESLGFTQGQITGRNVTVASLPAFDLVVMGDPMSSKETLALARSSGFTPEALAQLFPVGAKAEQSKADQSILQLTNLLAPIVSQMTKNEFRADQGGPEELASKLAEGLAPALRDLAAARAVNATEVGSVETELLAQLTNGLKPAVTEILEQSNGEVGGGEGNLGRVSAELAQNVATAANQFFNVKALASGDESKLTTSEIAISLAPELAPSIASLLKPGSAQNRTESVDNLSAISLRVAEALVPTLSQLAEGSDSQLSRTNSIQEQLGKDLAPAVAQLLDHQRLGVSNNTTVDPTIIAARLADDLAPTVADQLRLTVGPGSQVSTTSKADVSVRLTEVLVPLVTQLTSQGVSEGQRLVSADVSAIPTPSISSAQSPELARQLAQLIGFEGTGKAMNSRAEVDPSLQALTRAATLTQSSEGEINSIRSAAITRPAAINVAVLDDEGAPVSLLTTPRQVPVSVVGNADVTMSNTVSIATGQPNVASARISQQATADRMALRRVGISPSKDDSHEKLGSTSDAVTVTSKKASSEASNTMVVRDLLASRSPINITQGPVTRSELADLFRSNPTMGLDNSSEASSGKVSLAADSPAKISSGLGDRHLTTETTRLPSSNFQQLVAGRELAGKYLSETLGQRLVANVAAGNYKISFNMHPRELGIVDVIMEMRDGRLEAQINSSIGATRDLLGDSLPKLRDALQQSGVNVGQLEVGSDSQSNRDRKGDSANERGLEGQSLADNSAPNPEVVFEDLELGIDSIDFWA